MVFKNKTECHAFLWKGQRKGKWADTDDGCTAKCMLTAFFTEQMDYVQNSQTAFLYLFLKNSCLVLWGITWICKRLVALVSPSEVSTFPISSQWTPAAVTRMSVCVWAAWCYNVWQRADLDWKSQKCIKNNLLRNSVAEKRLIDNLYASIIHRKFLSYFPFFKNVRKTDDDRAYWYSGLGSI